MGIVSRLFASLRHPEEIRMSDQEPTNPGRSRQNLMWFVFLGCGIGFPFDQAVPGASEGAYRDAATSATARSVMWKTARARDCSVTAPATTRSRSGT